MPRENKFACVTFHSLGDFGNQYVISEDQFLVHLETLKTEGYVVEGFEQLEDRLKSTGDLPSRYAILTLDDGHQSSMRAADLLEVYGFRATFFLTRDRCLRRPGFIRSSEIRELRKRGFSVGSHGATHAKLTFLPQEKCIAELKESKEWLEGVLGENVGYLAAPAGFINSRVLRLAREIGYVLTGTCNEWINSRQCVNQSSMVNRVNMRRHFSSQDFRSILQDNFCFYIRRQVRSAALAIPKQFLR